MDWLFNLSNWKTPLSTAAAETSAAERAVATEPLSTIRNQSFVQNASLCCLRAPQFLPYSMKEEK